MFPVFRAFFSVRKGFEDLMDKGLEGRLGYRVKPAQRPQPQVGLVKMYIYCS